MWRASRGADLYVVQAFGAEAHESACETDSQSCVLAELLCGFTYNISVIAANSVCNVSQSGVTQLKAGKGGHDILNKYLLNTDAVLSRQCG